MHGHLKNPELGLWAAIHKETGKFIDCWGLLPWATDGQSEVEVTDTLAEDYQGQELGQFLVYSMHRTRRVLQP